eukprot:CAMPEP_0170181026 /NCGR_PEP_ID=MMETSP0040_2-20121228/23733_1 /TAXON_ID=641309 /ORGANISM="Lotharella oceanica, Strain CCMP622" /LENGTH=34 /DNA_ID= /DNA_START= /DNA_END= /DNA_ORIENTATION=
MAKKQNCNDSTHRATDEATAGTIDAGRICRASCP